MSEPFGLSNFGRGLIGAAVGTAGYPVLALPRVVVRVPRALAAGYKAVYRETSIGPNLKAVSFVLLPAGAVLVPALTAAATPIIGLFLCGYRSAFDGLGTAVPKMCQEVRDIDDKFVEDGVRSLEEYRPEKLLDGEKPFDISPLKALKGLLAGAVNKLTEGPALFGITLARLPMIYWRVLNWIFKDSSSNFPLKAFELLLATVALPLVPAVVAVGSLGYAFGAGVKRGYSNGFRVTAAKAVEDCKKWSKTVHEFARK